MSRVHKVRDTWRSSIDINRTDRTTKKNRVFVSPRRTRTRLMHRYFRVLSLLFFFVRSIYYGDENFCAPNRICLFTRGPPSTLINHIIEIKNMRYASWSCVSVEIYIIIEFNLLCVFRFCEIIIIESSHLFTADLKNRFPIDSQKRRYKFTE